MISEIVLQIILGAITVAATIWAANYTVKKAFEMQKKAFDVQQEMQKEAFAKQHEELELQRAKEKNSDDEIELERKKRLLIGLYLELDGIYKFQLMSEGWSVGENMHLETTLLEQAGRDQLRFIKDPKIVGDLFELRQKLGLIKRCLSEMNHLDREKEISGGTWDEKNIIFERRQKSWKIMRDIFSIMKGPQGKNGITERLITAIKSEYGGGIEKDSGSII